MHRVSGRPSPRLPASWTLLAAATNLVLGTLLCVPLCALLAPPSCAAPLEAAEQDVTQDYAITRTVQLGAPDRWDYLTFVPETRQLLVSHGDRTTIVDAGDGHPVGELGPIDGAHGQVALPALGQVLADGGRSASVMVFDLASRQPLATLPVGEDADAVVYDPASRRVFVINGDSGTVTAIDPVSSRVLATIPLGGKLEFAVADGQGHLFVNQADPRAVIRLDTATFTVTARWPLPGCLSPHGMGFDPQTSRVFTSCVNGSLVVVDAADGRVVATLPIGKGSDAVAVDSKRRLVFSSNGDGTLSVIRIIDASHFGPTRSVETQPGARTMAVDPQSGRVFLVTANVVSAGPPRLPGSSPSYTFAPGTVHLLFLDPKKY